MSNRTLLELTDFRIRNGTNKMDSLTQAQKYFEDAIRISVEAVQKHPPQLIPQWAISVQDSSVRGTGVHVVDYESAIFDTTLEMRNEESVRQVAHWVARDESAYNALFVDSQVTLPEAKESDIVGRVADFVVGTVLQKGFVPFRGPYSGQDIDRLVDHSWNHFLQYIYQFEEIELRWKTYLRGLDSIDSAYEIDPGMWLRPATMEEQADFYNLSNPIEGLRITRRWLPTRHCDTFIVPHVVLEGTEPCRLPRMDWHESAYYDQMSSLVFALRLVGAAAADSFLLWVESTNIFFPEQPQFQHVPTTNSHYGLKPPFKLSHSGVEQVRKFYLGSGIELASSAFNQSKRRLLAGAGKNHRADEFLDYWIGLEALFLKGIRQELSYRVSTRIAQFLGSDGDDRILLYKNAKKSYDARSKVAHGEEFIPDEEMVAFTASLLRRSLAKVVVSGALPDGNRLDEMMIRRVDEQEA